MRAQRFFLMELSMKRHQLWQHGKKENRHSYSCDGIPTPESIEAKTVLIPHWNEAFPCYQLY